MTRPRLGDSPLTVNERGARFRAKRAAGQEPKPAVTPASAAQRQAKARARKNAMILCMYEALQAISTGRDEAAYLAAEALRVVDKL